jgi:hypothetical protein
MNSDQYSSLFDISTQKFGRHKVPTLADDAGTTWFCGKDVFDALGFFAWVKTQTPQAGMMGAKVLYA